MNIEQELSKVGLDRGTYERCLSDISDKLNGINDLDWVDIRDKYNLPIQPDCLRKANSRPFGGAFVAEYMKGGGNVGGSAEDVLDQIRKERIKLQTLNVERNRIDRAEARQELFYEYIGSVCSSLPLPDFRPLYDNGRGSVKYILALSDIHYGATFTSVNNEYSRDIARKRLEYLCGRVIEFVKEHELSAIAVASLGDSLQGAVRVSDLKANDTEVVKCVVEISRLIAEFLNTLSEYVQVEYYHVPFANHTQVRPIGTKASELADEDFEYIISHYISDLCRGNERITVHLQEENLPYIHVGCTRLNIVAMHGHNVKNVETALRDMSMLLNETIDCLLLGHFHGGKELVAHEALGHDLEVLVAPSFIGSDKYSDRIMRGAKAAACIYGFDDVYGHTETHKIILN